MGQKVNPHGLRVGVIKDWDSRWYAEADFADGLVSLLLSFLALFIWLLCPFAIFKCLLSIYSISGIRHAVPIGTTGS